MTNLGLFKYAVATTTLKWRAGLESGNPGIIRVNNINGATTPTAAPAIFDFPGVQYNATGSWTDHGGGIFSFDFIDGIYPMRVAWYEYSPDIYYFSENYYGDYNFLISHWGLCINCDVDVTGYT